MACPAFFTSREISGYFSTVAPQMIQVPQHIVLLQDLEQPPRAAAAAILPFAVIERIGLAVRKDDRGFFGLMMDTDDDRQADAIRPSSRFLQRDLVPHCPASVLLAGALAATQPRCHRSVRTGYRYRLSAVNELPQRPQRRRPAGRPSLDTQHQERGACSLSR